MQDILGFTLQELKAVLQGWDIPPFRSRQILTWIYKKGVSDFERMSDIPAELRKKLQENYNILSLKIKESLKSHDDVEKYLFELKDSQVIEAVIIPALGWTTGCISTQVGCRYACTFCASGLNGFKRNLTCAEIMEEVLLLNSRQKLTHLVFMGTGEPLDNYDNLLKAIRIINSDYSFNIGARRITISTCGLVSKIRRLAKENLQVELSISLHGADDKTRSQIMPVNRKYPLKDLIEACKEYIEETGRQITFEYVLIKGLNSDLPNAIKLGKMLKEVRLAKVNLIPANAVKELNIAAPNKAAIMRFKDTLIKEGVNVTLRRPRGEDIDAACGQLRLKYEQK